MKLSKASKRLSIFFGLTCIGLGQNLLFATEITLLHTNDIHSHYRETRTPLPLGGIARIKTAVDRVKATHPHTLLVDGGDWSEGDIYYTQGAGAETLRMMDRIGYDAAVVGNHDWLNGPDVLLQSIQESGARVSLVSANLSTKGYERAEEFNSRILPYVIKQQGGIKIAFIGISTYEFVYDSFFAPIKITEPFVYIRTLSSQLKSQGKADVVVAISHNSTFVNKGILRVAPAIDLIIGGHDHKKLTEPEVVKRSDGQEAWVVEAGYWGQFLGQVDLTIDQHKKVKLRNYHLTQMDSQIPEDPQILSQIEAVEGQVAAQYGPVFDDQIGESQIRLERKGQNNGIGNLVTDAYFHTTGADFAMESARFLYGELQPGAIRTVDAYNTNPAIYNPNLDKSWSVQILPIKGKTLSWFLYALYATQKVSAMDLINVSGMHLVYDPVFSPSVKTGQEDEEESGLSDPSDGWWNSLKSYRVNLFSSFFMPQSLPTVSRISIQGQPLDPDRIYKVATGGGLIEGLRLYNSYSPFPISLKDLRDTGLENWRVLADYIHVNSPLNEDKVPVENRIQTLKPDLAIFARDIQVARVPTRDTTEDSSERNAVVRVRIKNYGSMQSPSGIAQVKLLLNKNGGNQALTPDYLELGSPVSLGALDSDQDRMIEWNIRLPLQEEPYEITALIEGDLPQVHLNNLKATQWVKF